MNKKEKIEITGMNIKIGKIDLSLSPVEARKLYDVLGEIFEKETIVQKEYVHWYPNYWYYPYYSDHTEYKYEYGPYTVWCDTGNQTLNVSDLTSDGILTETLSPYKINLTDEPQWNPGTNVGWDAN